MVRRTLLCIVPFANACGHSTAFYDECYVPAESSSGLETTSSLGFSANDVLEIMDLNAPVPVRSRSGDSADRDFAFAFTPDGTAIVEEGTSACADAVPGRSLSIPGTLSVAVDEDWLTATGPATIRATSAISEQVWVFAALAGAEASEALRDAAWEDAPDGAVDPSCTEVDVEFTFVQSPSAATPWSEGPVGGVDTHVCGYRAHGLYTWGALEP